MLTIKREIVYRIKLRYGVICCDWGKFAIKVVVIGFVRNDKNEKVIEIIVGQECVKNIKIW